MQKGIIVFLMLFVLGALQASAFLYDMVILDKGAIARLSDEKLLDTYIDVLVEVEALKTFYTRSGLVPKEYKQYKEVLKYRILLLQEIKKRKLEAPDTGSVSSVNFPDNVEIKELKDKE